MSVKDLKSGLASTLNNLRGIYSSGAAVIGSQTFYVIEFKCKDCGHKQQTMWSRSSIFMLEYFAFEFWWENFKKCPECGKKNWNVKIIGKKHPWDFCCGKSRDVIQ